MSHPSPEKTKWTVNSEKGHYQEQNRSHDSTKTTINTKPWTHNRMDSDHRQVQHQEHDQFIQGRQQSIQTPRHIRGGIHLEGVITVYVSLFFFTMMIFQWTKLQIRTCNRWLMLTSTLDQKGKKNIILKLHKTFLFILQYCPLTTDHFFWMKYESI
jgi:hypothetical protein